MFDVLTKLNEKLMGFRTIVLGWLTFAASLAEPFQAAVNAITGSQETGVALAVLFVVTAKQLLTDVKARIQGKLQK